MSVKRSKIMIEVMELLKKIPKEAREAMAIAASEGAGISDLELLKFPARYINNLQEQHGITTMRELLNKKPEELIALRQFGDSALISLYQCLAKYHELQEISLALE